MFLYTTLSPLVFAAVLDLSLAATLAGVQGLVPQITQDPPWLM